MSPFIKGCAAIALTALSATAFADEADLPKVVTPNAPPDIVLSCHYAGEASALRPNFTVEAWNSGVARRTVEFKAHS